METLRDAKKVSSGSETRPAIKLSSQLRRAIWSSSKQAQILLNRAIWIAGRLRILPQYIL